MSRIDLYPHQKEAIEKISTGSVLVGGVGTGKSRTAIAYYFTKECGGEIENDFRFMRKPKPLYIITTARKRDTLEWERELAPFLLSTNIIKSYKNTVVCVDSWNNIKKYVDVTDAFFIFDEQRLVGYGTWVKTFLKIAKKNNWILLTATPGDVWMDYVPLFIANGFFKNKTDFTSKHVVYSRFTDYPKIEAYVDTKPLERFRDKIMVIMSYEKKTERHSVDIFCEYDKELMKKIFKDRWDVYKDEPIRDASGFCYCCRRLVNSSEDRILKTINILENNNKVIVFYNFDYELDLLREICEQEKFTYAEWNGHKHEPIPISDEWVYLVQYTAGAEGWNCVETNVILFYSQNYSYKVMEQASGRIDRLNTSFKDLYYYHLKSNSDIDRAISNSIKKKKKFNEKIFSNF